MLSYIASNPMEDLIQNVCNELKITILSRIGKIDFLQYIKETKVNFKLIKYIVIDLKSLKGTNEKKINSISYFSEIYPNIRIVILASGYENQNIILTNLYEKGIYNIINSENLKQVKEELKKALTLDGISKKESKRFKVVKVKEKKSKKNKHFNKLIMKKNNKKLNIKKNEIQVENTSIYFFTLLIQAITQLLEFLGTVIIFGLTSLGLTIIFNESLRNIVFQILGLK